jgi:STE24 endopeptidase
MSTSPVEITNIERPVLDEGRQTKAREYSRMRRRLGFVDMALTLALLLVLVFSTASPWFTGLFSWPVIAVAVVYLLVILVGFEAVTSPLSYYRGFVLPRRYGISVQKLSGWLLDLAKSGGIGLILAAAAVALIYWFLLNYPDIWWLLAWALIMLVSLISSVVAPILLVPLFYKMKPLADGDLKAKLDKLAQKAGARVHGIFVLDFSARGTTANAGLMGIGRTRRIVISDTLIQQYSAPEIEVITAHEIGHHMGRDIFRLLVVQASFSLIVLKIVDVILKVTVSPLGFSGIADPAALPLLVLLFGAFITLASPFLNTFSRLVESQADAYALVLTNDSPAFIDSMTRLANQNLGVANPPKWEELLFYDHPSYNKRVAQARSYEIWRRS